MLQPKIQPQHQSQDTTDQHHDEEAPPLHLPRPARMPVRHIQLRVPLVDILHHVRRSLLDLHRRVFLHLDLLGQLLEQKAQIGDRGLDALDLVVAGADGTEGAVGGAGPVGFELWQQKTLAATNPYRGTIGGASAGCRWERHTAVWKTPSLPQSALAASLTSESVAFGFTIRYCLAICSRYRCRYSDSSCW